jgi:DNA replication and repair protein RecF
MRISHLSLTNFRNYTRLDVDIPGGSLLLIGGNAQGKTSFLEAIYFLATFTSFHATSDRQLINFLTAREELAVARIVADFSYSGDPVSNKLKDHHLEIRLIQELNGLENGSRFRKEVFLDGVKQKVDEVAGSFNAVLFLPQMLRIIEGSPQERRGYLDLAFGQVFPHYLKYMTDYKNSLSQRNALLKQLSERGGDPEQLTYWDEKVGYFGSQIIRARIEGISELEKHATRIHSTLTRTNEVLRFSYEPSFDPIPKNPLQFSLPLNAPIDRLGISLEEIRAGFLEKLKELRTHEILRGVTTIGPHRDELRFLSNGIDLGTYGSRGQARTAILSTKLAEVNWMKERTKQCPVLLLDEVLAELDPNRRSDLIQHFLENEQSLLTTTDLDMFSNKFVQKSQVWQISKGQLISQG